MTEKFIKIRREISAIIIWPRNLYLDLRPLEFLYLIFRISSIILMPLKIVIKLNQT